MCICVYVWVSDNVTGDLRRPRVVDECHWTPKGVGRGLGDDVTGYLRGGQLHCSPAGEGDGARLDVVG